MARPYHALIFDYDGVIVLSEPPRFKVLQQTFARLNIVIPDQWYHEMVGRTTRVFLSQVLPRTPTDQIEAGIAAYEAEYKGHIEKYIVPIPASVNFLRQYHGPVPLGLASMSSQFVVSKALAYFGLQTTFQAILTKEEVSAHKPDPEPYLKIAAKMGLAPTSCVTIEDTQVGVSSAKRAGMDCYVLLNTANSPANFTDQNPDGYITTTADLLALVSS